MGIQLLKNNASTTLATPCSDVATEITLTDGSIFPNPTGGDWFLLTVYQLSGAQEVNYEIMKCTARAGNVLTVSRAFEDATRFPARSYTAGNFAELRDTAGTQRTAGSIDNVPAGNIAATTVQAAINELDSEKAALAQVHYVGTTSIAANRASAAQALTGITSIDGNAATVTTNANLSGHVTSVGNAASLGSFTVAQLNTAISDADVATGGGTATNTNTGDNSANTLYSGLVSNANHTGDATGDTALTVVKINGTLLSGLDTGLLKNTTGTGVPGIAVAGTDYVAPGGALGTPSSGTLTNCTGLPSSALAGVPLTAQTTGFTATGGTTPKTLTVDDDLTTAQAARRNAANTFTGQQTFAEVKDTVYTITDGAAFEIDPVNGSVQIVTLGASRTPAATNFEAGQTVLLGINDGTAYSITWTTVAPTWVKVGGTGVAPTLATTGYTWVLLWKVASTIYGCEVGKP